MTRIKQLRVTYTIRRLEEDILSDASLGLRYGYMPISEQGGEIYELVKSATAVGYDLDDSYRRDDLCEPEYHLDALDEGPDSVTRKADEKRKRRETARDLLERCRTLLGLLAQRLPPVTYEIERQRLEHAFEVRHLEHTIDDSRIKVWYTHKFEPDRKEQILVADLTLAQRRLLSSINTSIRRLAWEHLVEQLGGRASQGRPQVFISYRKGHERFAERLAMRLGQEGLVPWFDKWDILAGDSIPGKIEAAFRESVAFLPVLTADYQAGPWAVEELMTAITKRIKEGYRIIPIRLEECRAPELIDQLRYVDFSEQDPEAFEQKMAEVIDAIYGLEQNPFR